MKAFSLIINRQRLEYIVAKNDWSAGCIQHELMSDFKWSWETSHWWYKCHCSFSLQWHFGHHV